MGFAVTYGFAEQVYQFLAAPLADIYAGQESRRMIYTGLAEGFITYLKLAMFSGFILAFPVIAAQLYFFVAPGLYKRERRVMLPFLLFSPLLFLCGAALAYYGVFPLAWKFFTGFEMRGADGLPIILEARISEYLSLVMRMIIAFGLAFQLPILLMLLVRGGFVTSGSLRKGRKYALVVIFIAAAILTPPDVVSQVCLAVPLLVLYEASVWACRSVEREKMAKELAENDA
ncbi:MAG: twin-arginine translocase subunit TatC [Rickettsiales bacterium]|nr:twin-arginine translocase subunit TatC [Rickettsiales bacterium]